MRPIYYDLETTGLSSKEDKIIEIAAFDPALDKTFSSLVNPKMDIPEASTRITNITNDMVALSPTFDSIGKEFIDFCSGDIVLIAHNNDGFDKHFLKQEFSRTDTSMPDWRYLDSLKWARKYRPDLPKHSLQYLREIYKIKQNNAHRALDDVIVLEKIFSKMIDDLEFSVVYKLYNQKKKMRMPFGKHRGKALSEVPKNYVTWLIENGALDKDENKDLKQEFLKLGIGT